MMPNGPSPPRAALNSAVFLVGEHGLQLDNVLALWIVTGDGKLRE